MSTSIYDFLEGMGDNSTMVGVDALTITTTSPLGAIGVRAALELLEKEEVVSTSKKRFNFNGAQGWASGPVRWASKSDRYGKGIWQVLMITGPEASMLLPFVSFELKATRVDLRVDVVMSKPYPELAQKMYNLQRGVSGRDGRYISSLTGDTFYPSINRENTYYGRVYDKSYAYGEVAGAVWRWELEVKRKAAHGIVERLLSSENLERDIEEIVFGVFSEQWRTPTPRPGAKPTLNYSAATIIVGSELKLAWLRRNVAPTIRKLVAEGLKEQVQEALGLFGDKG